MKNLRDKKVIYTLIIALLLIGLHIWQYVKSGHDSRALINLVMCSVFVPLIIFCGMSCLPYFLLAYCYIYLPFEEYDNYTSLFLLCSAISLNKRLRLSFIPYIIETIIVYMVTGLEISHLCVTLLYILFFWQVYVYIQDRHANIEPLQLTIDEEKILEQLCKGKEVKELGWSENTVYKKLREARIRNGCLSNDELKTKFRYRDII